ncbi:MAG: single-stranded-DNA-specific exonuclease RecJ, partial [Gammaproteobacteria bacterium]
MHTRRITRRAASTEPRELLGRLCAARGMDVSELALPLAALVPPATMRGLPEAAMRLADALESGEEILVVGDYDADGA